MANYNAPIAGGTVNGSVFADVITGSSAADVLYGLGGDDIIIGGDGADKLDGGTGNDTLRGGTGADILIGGDGIDVADYASSLAAVVVNLSTGLGKGGDAEGDTLSTIENLIGTAYADTLIGDAGANRLDGGAGDDTIEGGDGADTIIGGTGIDTVSYANATSGVTFSLQATDSAGIGGQAINKAAGGYAGAAAGDTYSGIEKVVASGFNDFVGGSDTATTFNLGAGDDVFDGVYSKNVVDTIYGEAGKDTIYAGLGNDFLYGGADNDSLFAEDGDDLLNGGAGADILDGGAGTDTASYSDSALGINANLVTGLGTLGDAAGDKYVSIENVIGSNFDDIIFSNSTANNLSGGAGIDTIDYATSNAAVTIDLGLNKASGGFAAGDIIAGFENANGSTFNDVLTGSSEANLLFGSAGDDKLYGLAGDDNLRGGTGADLLDGGTGNDLLNGGAGADTFIGGDGIDTVSYVNSDAGVTINLATGLATGGDAQGDTFSSVENLVGSKFDDVLTGSDVTNVIEGGDGNDAITGGAGDDKLYGGAGDDTFKVEWSNSGDYYDGGVGVDTFTADVPVLGAYAQEIDLVTGENNWKDKFVSIENLVGGSNNDKFWGTDDENSFWGRLGNDLLDGRSGNDKLYGEEGDDTLIGGAGADVINGGSGVDVADYSSSLLAVTVNLESGTGIGGDAQGDTLSSVENLVGSKFNDTLIGDAGANILTGNDGDDTLRGGAGADQLIGGLGSDTADYSSSAQGVTINLATGLATGGDAQGDTLSSIENVTGSAFNDFIVGTESANILNGGAGIDTLDYSASNGGINVNLVSGIGTGGHATGDRVSGFEVIVGTSFADTIIGDASDNTFYGGNGIDKLVGGDGIDTIYGGADDDAILGDAGNDILFGDAGNDRITGGIGADQINGGDGVDTADYRYSVTGVSVSLTTNTGTVGDAAGDVLSGIENLTGSLVDDILVGDEGVNRLVGLTGADKLYGMGGNDYIHTGAGYDYVDGGTGIDTVTYEDSWDYVWVNLATGINQYGEASRDVLVNVENIMGSAFNDKITGDAGANRLNGMAGDDQISGGGGIDYIIGGAGNDTSTGGTEADVFIFDASFGKDTVTDFWAGTGRTDRLWLTNTDLHNYADVLAHTTDTSAGLVISVNGGADSITLTGIHLPQINADDFLF